MDNELTTYEGKPLIIDNQLDKVFKEKAVELLRTLHAEPDKSEVQTNTFANNTKYLPISFLEMKLDELFYGLWETRNFTTKVVANEIVGEIELRIFHPDFKIWLSRIGAGAVQVQFSKGTSFMDMANKIQNTLTKDYPHLKAECIRNACLSLGKAFGRDLNRKLIDQYNPPVPDMTEEEIAKDNALFEEYSIAVNEYEKVDELKNKAKAIVKQAEDEGMSEVNIALLKNQINEKIKSLRGK